MAAAPLTVGLNQVTAILGVRIPFISPLRLNRTRLNMLAT